MDLILGTVQRTSNIYLKNLGNDTFANRTNEVNINGLFSDTRGMTTGDYDNDGDVDVFISNTGPTRNYFFQNNATMFNEISQSLGLALPGNGSHSAEFADYDNDGDLDLLFGDIVRFFRNDNGAFTDVTVSAGLNLGAVPFRGSSFSDLDNDGDLDIIMLANLDGKKAVVFQNNDNGTFTDVTATSGLNGTLDGRYHTLAIADYDNDGRTDLFIGLDPNSQHLLYRNITPIQNWIKIKLIGMLSNKAAIDARIEIKAGGEKQIREINGGKGYRTQDDIVQHFGLADAVMIDSLKITWPSGFVQVLNNVAVNQIVTIIESEQIDIKSNFVFLADDQIIIQRQDNSEGNLHSNDDIQFKAGKSSIHTGNLTAVNRIKIRKKNTINGDVKAGGSVDNDGTVNGSIEEGAMVSEITLPSLSFSAGGSNETVPKNGLFTLAPGSYRNVKVHRGGRLEISSGDYFMKSLNLDRSSVLSINVSEGAVTINVVGLISFDKNAEVEIVPFGESGTDQVTFNSLNDGSLKFRSGVKLLGSIVAPHAKASIDKNARFKGSLCARVISIGKGVTFLHHSSATSLPKALSLAEDERENVERTSLPTEYALDQNYPNPFNPSTTITFSVPQAGDVGLSIYNLRGQLVKTLVSGAIAAGRHSAVWDGRDSRGLRVASGIYVYRLTAKDFVATRKLAITK